MPRSAEGSEAPSGSSGRSASKVRGLVSAVLGVDETLQQLNSTLDRFDETLLNFNTSMERFNDALDRIASAVEGIDSVRTGLDAAIADVADLARRLGEVTEGIDTMVGPARTVADQLRRLGGRRPETGRD